MEASTRTSRCATATAGRPRTSTTSATARASARSARALGVTAFGVNAIVLPPGIETGFHFHDEQEELYFVHRGAIEMEFGDGSVQTLARGRLRARGRRDRCARSATPATSTPST